MGKGARLFLILIMVAVSCVLDDGTATVEPVLSAWHLVIRVGRRRIRVIVYVRSIPDKTDDDRLRGTADMCARRGYIPVAVVRELPGETRGLEDALRMVREGEAERIVLPSGAELPDVIESDTGSLSRRRVDADVQRAARRRRIRPTRRGDGGA